ncbi:MAG: bifunctional hydroxymethylpyrimidine kinase/phosphomethylpyrimidine kinase, partial [Oscillospiraceae bacterium]|nr:bifunctional hydroxymethylpyrimidine kinase/phosphomethylpyrimidine kinase [Oscillospiraceae bacterium]
MNNTNSIRYNQPRVLTMQDISCMGRCSLTVALPILSAAGIETSILPTAILSTHTGNFTGYTFRDLTDDIGGIISHWDDLGATFDAVYTGYLGSERQLAIAGDIFDKYKASGALIVVDPVMGDDGRMYAGFSDDFPRGMAGLCAKADIIVPNLTEAAFLLGEPYIGAVYDESYIEGILHRLHGLGADKIVLTGVSFDHGNREGAYPKIGAACL